MARKKEPERTPVNQKRIVEVAKELFMEKGIESTKMDEVAKQAGMSKSTLYVYFKSKEEIVDYISLEAMKYLLELLKTSISRNEGEKEVTFHDQYMAICHAMVTYKKEYPMNFQAIVEEIRVDDESLKEKPILREIFETGEEINQFIIGVLLQGQSQTDSNQSSMEGFIAKIFAQWGSIYGLIVLADNKKAYIQKCMHLTKEEFLEQGFEQLYRTMK